MKLIAALFCLVISTLPSAAQAPGSSPSPAVGAGVSAFQRAQWLAEAESLTHAEIIGKGMVAGTISRMGADVVAKGDIDGPVSLVSGNLFVLGRVNGPISVIGGGATILGSALGPVSVIGGNLRVAGRIDGDVSVVGGRIERTDDAVIKGTTSTVGSSLAGLGRGLGKFGGRKSAVGWLWWRGLMMVWWIGASALAVLIMPRELESAAAQLGREPLRTAAFGLLLTVVIVFLAVISVVLCFFLVGIPILGLLILAGLRITWFGLSVVFLWFGRLLCERMGRRASSEFLPMFAGAFLLSLLRFIPFGGFLIWFAANLLGSGITLMVLAQRRKQAPLPPAAPPLPPPVSA